MNNLPLVICLLGPTAAGKTALAVELARRFPVSVISVDSALVYRGMDIGTGKPGPAVLAEVPHRLIDIREPWQSYSAGEFVRDGRAAIAEVVAAGRIPLLVGGTMLYFRSLWHGLSALPTADPEVRAAIDLRAASDGWPALHAELARSISRRSRASERRSSRRRTSGWHHSRSHAVGPELASEQGARRRVARSSSASTSASGSPQRVAGSVARNGPWCRAQRTSKPPSASATGARKASGTPTGGITPSASR